MTVHRGLASFVCVAGLAAQQNVAVAGQAAAPPLEFEAASVRQNRATPGPPSFRDLPWGRIRIPNMVVRDLIGFAYEFNVLGLKVEGGPSWIDHDRFDIEAIGDAEQEAAATPESGPPAATPAPSPRPVDPRRRTRAAAMLRTLMEQRFKLRAHRATVEREMYALVIAAPDGTLGPGLRRSTATCSPGPGEKPAVVDRPDDCGTRTSFAGGIAGRDVPLVGLASMLSRHPGVGRPVVDRTGLSGSFDFTVELGQDVGASPIEQGARLLTALEDQLGLKLEPIQGTQELIVIDRVEHPAPNP